MNTELFRILGTIAVDNDKANRAIDDTTGKAEKSEGRMTSAFKKIGAAVVTYFAADKIINFGKACVESAATVQAQTAQFKAAFKELQGEASKSFEQIATDTGVLSTRLRTVGTQAFSQFKGAGLDAAEALRKTDEFTRLAADGAAYYDMSLEETSELMRSFIRGNTEAGDRIGLFTSETQRNQAALDALGKKYIECTESEKQMIMLDIANSIYESSGAMGQAAREADGYENVVGNLKEAWRQFQAVIGKPILEKTIPILKGITEKIMALQDNTGNLTAKLKSLLPIIGSVVAAFAAWKTGLAVSKGVATLTTTLGALNTMAKANALHLVAANGGLSAMQMVVGVLTGKIKLLTLAQGALNASFLASPIGMITTIIVSFIAVVGVMTTVTKKQTDEQRKLRDSIHDTTKAIHEDIDAYKELEAAREEQLQSSVAEIDYLKVLKSELDGIVDANGHVKTGYEDRAAFIVGQLSEATGIEISLIDGVITEYGKLDVAIDSNIEKMRAHAIMSAYKEQYEASIRNLRDYEANQNQAYNDMIRAKEYFDKVMAEKHIAGNSSVAIQQRKRILDAKEHYEATKQNYEDTKQLTVDTWDFINGYESMSVELSKGNYDEINSIYAENAQAQIDYNNMKKADLEKSIREEKASLAVSRDNWKATGDQRYKDQIDAHEKSIAEMESHLNMLNEKTKTGTLGVVGEFKKMDEDSLASNKTTNKSRLLDFQNTFFELNNNAKSNGSIFANNLGTSGKTANTKFKKPWGDTVSFFSSKFKSGSDTVKTHFTKAKFKSIFDNSIVGGLKDIVASVKAQAGKIWEAIKSAFTEKIKISFDFLFGGGSGGGTAGVGGIAARGNGINFYKISGMGNPRVHNNKGRKSADYSAPRGTPIPAQQNGVISGVRVISTRERYRPGSYGRYVTIKSGGKQYVYAHMNGFSSNAKVGRPIAKGQVIGYVGQSGNAYGCHLHYGLLGYKTGGMPENGEIFQANEEGIEMMGKLGKKNVVANNLQIVDMVTGAVASGMANALKPTVKATNENGTLAKIYNLLSDILQRLSSFQIVLDSGAMVGNLYPALDRKITKEAKRRERSG